MNSSSRTKAASRRLGWLTGCLIVTLGAATWWSLSAEPLTGPQPSDYRVTRVVQSYLENDHLTGHPLDDEISRRAMKTFLSSFDPRKMYFYQSDVDRFMQKETSLDDDVKRGRVDFAYDVFRVFLDRLDERVALVQELVKEDFDFTVDEEMITDPELLSYPANAEEARERWRKLVKYNLLVARADKEDEEEARKKLARRYESLDHRWHQTSGDELLERFLTSITTSYDPHTTYMSPSTLENFRILMRLNLEGIGAALQISEDGYTVVTKIIPGGAADKHGKLKPDDRIVSVGQGEDGEMVDVVDKKLNDVVSLIRGPAGSVVRLGVQSPGSTETKIYKITRAKIELDDSAARYRILERGQKPDGSPVKVGVIDLPSFYMDMEAARASDGNGQYRSTTRDVRRILNDFNSQGVDVVVLDLSNNGGGSLTEAISLTGLFIEQGPVVQVKDSAGRVQQYDDLEPSVAWKGPLVVLVSKFSASASEILAGAVQDYHRGLVIGDESTHGKGTVQSLLDLGSQLFRIPNPPNLGALKITMQQFYRPNGDSTQKRGVIPDVVLPSLSTHVGLGEADLDYAIDFDRVKPARFSSYNLVPPDVIGNVKNRSAARVEQNEEFAELKKEIERYKELKEAKSVPLNEEKFLARRKTQKDAEEEQEKHIEEATGGEKEIFPDDFYNNEVIAITLDYLNELQRRNIAQLN